MNIISTHNFSKCGPAENCRRFMKIKDYPDFDEFHAEMGVFSLIKRNVMQFINYVLRVQSTHQSSPSTI